MAQLDHAPMLGKFAILAITPPFRLAIRVAAFCSLALYGLIVGVLAGHLWFLLFVVPSTVEFLKRRDLWASEQQFYVACAALGASALLWFGVGARNGHFGFGELPTLRGGKRRIASIGAVYGAAAGLLMVMMAAASISLTLAAGSGGGGLWLASPHLIILLEVSAGGAVGSIVGALLALALVKPSTGNVVSETTASIWPVRFAVRRALILVAIAYALSLVAMPTVENPFGATLLLIASSTVVCFSCVAIFIRWIVFVPPGDPLRSALAYIAWAIAAGAITGAGIGLRVATFVNAVELYRALDRAWLFVSGGGATGAYVGLLILRSATRQPGVNPR